MQLALHVAFLKHKLHSLFLGKLVLTSVALTFKLFTSKSISYLGTYSVIHAVSAKSVIYIFTGGYVIMIL